MAAEANGQPGQQYGAGVNERREMNVSSYDYQPDATGNTRKAWLVVALAVAVMLWLAL